VWGLDVDVGRRAGGLTVGQKQLLAFARALACAPEILILDEIFAVGDAGFRERCEARFRELSAAGHTVVLVSHIPRMIEMFCDRAVLIECGRVLVDGPPRDVAQQYLSLLTGHPERVSSRESTA
jgi:ABC-type polysaccharide/polyol phosphate transport system ATPase subunit